MEEKDLYYSRCPNCGKYFASEEDDKQNNDKMFCSNECKNYYKVCISCGNYFISSRIENKIYCSETCGTNPEPQGPPMEKTPDLLINPIQVYQRTSADNL